MGSWLPGGGGGGGAADAPKTENSRLLFALFADAITPFVVIAYSESVTICGEALGYFSRNNAATPAVCGAAMDVPVL